MKPPANGAALKNSQHPPHYYPELPIEVEERLEKLFKKLDVNDDGQIDIKDLTTGLRKLGLPHSPGSAEVSIPHRRLISAQLTEEMCGISSCHARASAAFAKKLFGC